MTRPPGRKPIRQWRFSATWHTTILATITPDRHISRSRWVSTTPPHWRRKHCLPSEYGRPPWGLTQGSQRRALRCLPGLGAPKHWKLSGWRNQWGYKWQVGGKNLSVFQNNATTYRCSSWDFSCLNPHCGAWRHTSSEMELRADEYFSIGYPAMRLNRHWNQKPCSTKLPLYLLMRRTPHPPGPHKIRGGYTSGEWNIGDKRWSTHSEFMGTEDWCLL